VSALWPQATWRTLSAARSITFGDYFWRLHLCPPHVCGHRGGPADITAVRYVSAVSASCGHKGGGSDIRPMSLTGPYMQCRAAEFYCIYPRGKYSSNTRRTQSPVVIEPALPVPPHVACPPKVLILSATSCRGINTPADRTTRRLISAAPSRRHSWRHIINLRLMHSHVPPSSRRRVG